MDENNIVKRVIHGVEFTPELKHDMLKELGIYLFDYHALIECENGRWYLAYEPVDDALIGTRLLNAQRRLQLMGNIPATTIYDEWLADDKVALKLSEISHKTQPTVSAVDTLTEWANKKK